MQAVEAARQTIASNGWVASKRDHGTPGSLEPMYAVGAAPLNNFSRSGLDDLGSLALEEDNGDVRIMVMLYLKAYPGTKIDLGI